MQWGKFVPTWERRALRKESVPDHYYNRPEPSLTDSYYIAAWNDLATERPVGMAEGRIPRSKVKQYGIDDLGLSGDQLDFFIRVIRRADDLHLSSKSSASSDPKMLEEVSVKDGPGMRSLLHRLAAPKNSRDRFVKKTKPKDET